MSFKLLPAQFAYLTAQPGMRTNLRELTKYLVFLAAMVVAYSLLFHALMLWEGKEHSWLTGFYWTLTVMTTLGFGDITFSTDLGRVFSIVVLVSGVVFLLIILPFAFIRFFYGPYLEAQIRMRAPRAVPAELGGHVLICNLDSIAPGLVERLRLRGITSYLLERDPVRAAQLHSDELPVLSADPEDGAAWQRAGAERARLVFANAEDTTNTNIALTVRSVSADVPIAAVASDQRSIDILELSGVTRVLPLKQQLGEQLANRVNAGNASLHSLGSFRELQVAELSVHRTPLVGKTIRETRLRQTSGLNIIGVWERGHLLAVRPDLRLTASSVLVVIGTQAQIDAFNELLVIYDVNPNAVVVIGGGRVGLAAAQALRARQIPVTMVERQRALAPAMEKIANRVEIGDAADRELLMHAGLSKAPSVLLTTADDAMNIYLAVYCRRLNPELRIVSRITDQKNLDAIHRAGADLALSYASLGIESVMAMIQGHELVLLGEGVGFFDVALPFSLQGKTLAELEVGSRTGLNVIAIQAEGRTLSQYSPDLRLPPGGHLLACGTEQHLEAFHKQFGVGPLPAASGE